MYAVGYLLDAHRKQLLSHAITQVNYTIVIPRKRFRHQDAPIGLGLCDVPE